MWFYFLYRWEFHSDDPPGEIRAALEFAEHYVIEKFGSSQECQIIVISDGRIPQDPNFIKNSESHSTKFHNPLWRLHIICLADEVSKDDHSKQTNNTLQWYKKLLNRHLPSRVTKNHPKGEFTLEKEGAFYFLLYPHTTYKITNAINVIAEKYLVPCKGILSLGKITMSIHVYPIIHIDDDVQQLIKIMSIVGFKPKELLQGESTYQRFWMFLNDEINENGCNEYFHILNSSLKKENRVAIVWLQNNTYATIEAPLSGSYFYFTMYSHESAKNLMTPSPMPINTQPKSYLSNNIELPKTEFVESMLNKIPRYVANLPNETAKLTTVIQQISRITDMFCYTSLREKVIENLQDLRIQSPEAENRAILTQCLQLLGDTDLEEEDDDEIEAMDYEEEREDPEDYEDHKNEERGNARISLNDLLNW
ncbi:von willebrand factor a domain-containing protein 9-like [Gigaspora margarita]|uniref:von willebrand factor a domain-containing protein 9-like n=1 Tax=Gigaspora margarita TaxID=4874 RepID=A0A8H4A504_GIGMA|nr:von willebrand factor a domain-containing protein 9-like [Gigaspora margarita]